MKKGIEIHGDYDENGYWYYVIEKKRGKLSVDEVVEIMNDFDGDLYYIPIRAIGSDDAPQFAESPNLGDRVELYRMEDFERKKK